MTGNLIQRLNELHGKSPDEIALAISDPLRMFIKCSQVTQGLIEAVNFRTRPLAYFAFDLTTGRARCWNARSSAETTRKVIGTRTKVSTFRVIREWAFIGYEHRMEVDPFAIDWATYEYIPYPE